MARDRHQALEPRWAKGIWLGHARSTNAALVATSEGVIKVWGFRRLPEGQLWDGDTIIDQRVALRPRPSCSCNARAPRAQPFGVEPYAGPFVLLATHSGDGAM